MTKDVHREPRTEKSCPLPSAHTRLHDAHKLWHRVVAAYPDPDEFVLQLNQFLTILRQVTFMVQTEKDKFDDFDTWYGTNDRAGEWQERMKADPLMVWLRDARNTVEKQGDLELATCPG